MTGKKRTPTSSSAATIGETKSRTPKKGNKKDGELYESEIVARWNAGGSAYVRERDNSLTKQNSEMSASTVPKRSRHSLPVSLDSI